MMYGIISVYKPHRGLSAREDSSLSEGQDWNRFLRMGTSISAEGGGTRGTLGGFILLEGGDVGFITCGHVVGSLESTEQMVGKKIYQSANDPRSVCGEVLKVRYDPGSPDRPGVDVTLVKVTDRNLLDARFIRVPEEQLTVAGFDKDSLPTFALGKVISWEQLAGEHSNCKIVKFGAQSGLTAGHLYSDGLVLRQCIHPTFQKAGNQQYNIMLFNQIEIIGSPNTSNGFFEPGDSGALVFVIEENQHLKCLGMAVGYTSYGSCITSPISSVLEALKCAPEFIDFTKN